MKYLRDRAKTSLAAQQLAEMKRTTEAQRQGVRYQRLAAIGQVTAAGFAILSFPISLLALFYSIVPTSEIGKAKEERDKAMLEAVAHLRQASEARAKVDLLSSQ